jgi:hypothetical protein
VGFSNVDILPPDPSLKDLQNGNNSKEQPAKNAR